MLYQQIQLGVPAIWVTTKDFHRLTDMILSSSLRNFYTIDKGVFSKYENNSWKPVLVQMPSPQSDDPNVQIAVTTGSFEVAVQYLSEQEDKNQSTFLLYSFDDAAKTASRFASFTNSLMSDYRRSFMTDNNDMLPLQIILFCSFACPEEYKHLYVEVEDGYPTYNEILDIITHMYSSTNGEIFSSSDSKYFAEIAKSALGMTEFTMINTLLNSVIETGKVNSEYVYKAKMFSVKRNGILEVVKPKIKFENIGGLDKIKEVITKNVYFWQNPKEAEKFGISPIRRILTVGVPGTGKSAICEATASALGLDLVRTGVSQVMNSYVGQSEANMRAVFRQIKVMAPLCVWIDEFGRDLSGSQSSSVVDGGTTDRVHGEFLTGLQELPENVFLMCAANQIDNLRPEMLRAERFDKIFFVGLPAFEERIQILKIYLDHGDYNYERLADKTKYFTGAEIRALIKQAKFDVVSTHHRQITTEDIIAHVPMMRNILWNKDKEMIRALYRTAYEQWEWSSTLQFNDINDILGRSSTSSNNWEVKL
jgi:AAA+ superfamily predicted ATPase